jgi:hypothetical protein
MMKKILGVSFLSFSLVACGGGGGGSYETTPDGGTTESGVNNSSFDSFTQFNWGSVQFKTGFVEIIKNARNSDILYTNYKKLEPSNLELYKRPILSKDGLYEPDQTNYPLGYRTYKINSVSKDGNTFNKTPYTLKGLNQFNVQENGEWIALDNVVISERTAVYWNILAKEYPNSVWFNSGPLGKQFKNFLASTNVTKFPTGAKCFKSSKTTYSLPYFVITNLDAKPYINGQFISTFDQFLNVTVSNNVSGNWGGTPWAYQKMYDGSEYYVATIYANINNKLSEGYWNKSPNITLENRLKVYTDLLKEPNLGLEDKISFNAAIKEINSECTYYNDIAANTIETLINKSSIN